MNRDPDFDSRIASWLREEAQVELPDRVLRSAFERTRAEQRQRGIRGWLSAHGLRLGERPALPARRGLTMFSAARITAVALSLVMGTGLVLTMREGPAELPGGVPAAETAEGAAQAQAAGLRPPVEFSGKIHRTTRARFPTTENVEFPIGDAAIVRQERRGQVVGARALEMSDPRLEGAYTITFNYDDWFSPGVSGPLSVGSETWRIVNDEGAWQGSYHSVGFPDDLDKWVTPTLIGERAYEGLIAIFEVDNDYHRGDWIIRGVIIDGDLPPMPESVGTR